MIEYTDNILKEIIKTLNLKQKEAVLAPASGRLQIIAGPGTGKTKVITSRVAYLLLHEKILPQNIIVTTFTRKAAKEMLERLQTMLDGSGIEIGKILIGTFHSVCYRIIKKYGNKIGVSKFNVANEKDSLKLLQETLTNLTSIDLKYIASLGPSSELFKTSTDEKKTNGYDIKKIKRQISRLKSSAISAEAYSNSNKSNSFLSFIYERYQKKIQSDFLLDYDDCLLYCYELLQKFPVLNFVQHVFVDEFQDTNEIQLLLLYQFAKGHPTNIQLQNNLTVVGDPDQSIYAFRDAQSINFEKMRHRYHSSIGGCNIITLDENYRSTKDILSFSESVMTQQNNRLSKALRSQMNITIRPVYNNLSSPEEEAKWIIYQIEHLMALPNSAFSYNDISILVRSSYQTRNIENELVKSRIPYEVVKGKAFWDRKEVVAILNYLRVIANDNDRLAILGTINFPKRGIGEKTIAVIERALELKLLESNHNQSLFQTLKSVVNDGEAKLSKKSLEALQKFINFIEKAKDMLRSFESKYSSCMFSSKAKISLNELFEFVYSKSGIQSEFQSDPNYELNIREVGKQLSDFQPTDDDIPIYLGGDITERDVDERNFLLRFVQSIGLSDIDSSSQNLFSNGAESKGKMSLSTIHGSKGLEWPVVFVPGLCENLLPAKFALESDDMNALDEERRCFYVATTRARSLLYISSYTESSSEGKWGRQPIEQVLRFISSMVDSGVFSHSQEAFKDWNQFCELYELIAKKMPVKNDFDLSSFYSCYSKRLSLFLRGSGLLIKEFSSSPEGFVSASSQLNRKRSSSDFRTNTLEPLVKISKFKDDVKRHLHYANKAIPSNGPTRAPSITDIKIKTPKNNKAPPYIPTRKVPSRYLNKRKT
ncbi:uncharacterized protein PRCAT00005370001 [Priceomyces carsonii]|uniref:uncharacterized protein n=1 Tax=Priceomyces carsonii TaxID=28549 RepID=UPI002ED9014F|nr:unnamed protein product [Priceomyces carsonii]